MSFRGKVQPKESIYHLPVQLLLPRLSCYCSFLNLSTQETCKSKNAKKMKKNNVISAFKMFCQNFQKLSYGKERLISKKDGLMAQGLMAGHETRAEIEKESKNAKK